ncbi:MAG: type II toxin-antitoxin system Phd/YefM family antitoxin [Acidimicrobiales bacterium]
MEEVGVREIRQHASEYLRRVERGESLCITSRGRPVAVVLPVAEAVTQSVAKVLQELVDSGAFENLESAIALGVEEATRRVSGAVLDELLVTGYQRQPEEVDHWLDRAAWDTLTSVEWK